MRWLLVNYSRFVSVLCVAQFTAWVPLSQAVDDSRLWLPANHNRLFLDLRDAAHAAERLSRCVTVLQGTIDLDESAPQKPIYRILCRQQNGQSYNELVDGISFEALTTNIVITPAPTAQELEKIRLAEEAKRQQEALEVLNAQWLRCEAAINAKVSLMNDVQWRSEIPAQPRALEGGAVEFLMDFDAKSIQGVGLRYHARCQFLPDNELNTKIYARK